MERLPGAVQIFAAAAKDAGKTDGSVAQLNKLMEDGKALAKDVLPFVAVRLKVAARANGALELALKSLNVKLAKGKVSLQLFEEGLFNRGVKDGLSFLLNGFNDLSESSTLLSTILGGIFKGAVLGLTIPFRALYAVVFDITKLLGLHDAKGFDLDLIAVTSTVLGLVPALWLLFHAFTAVTGIIAGASGLGVIGAATGALVTAAGALAAVLSAAGIGYAAGSVISDKLNEDDTDFNMDLGRFLLGIESLWSKDAEMLLANEARVGGFTEGYNPKPNFIRDLLSPDLAAAEREYAAQQSNLDITVHTTTDTELFNTHVNTISSDNIAQIFNEGF